MAIQAEIDDARDVLLGGNTDEAIRRLRALTGLYPKDARAWRELGKVLASLDRNEEALDALTRSTWSIGRDRDTWVLLAVTAARANRHKESLAHWRTALEIDPTLFTAQPHLAVLWRESQQHNEFGKLVKRLSGRNDAAACMLLLDAVVGAADAELALESVLEDRSPSQPLLIVKQALRIAIGDGGAGADLIAELSKVEDGEREQVWVRLIRWLSEKSGRDPNDAVPSLLHQTDDRELARAAYRAAPPTGQARVIAATALARGILSALSTISALA